MALDLSDTLVIGISSTALFDLSEGDALFRERFAENRESAVREYRDYMLQRENDSLEPGTGMPLVKALLKLNEHEENPESPLVEVVVMSRNSPETGVRVLNNIRNLGLPISRHAFTGGESVVDYLEAYDVDLFLTTNIKDAQRIIDSGRCATALVKPPPTEESKIPEGQVRIAFDGDAVLFDESSEIVYRTKGLDEFQRIEDEKQAVPMRDGPYAVLLRKLARLQVRLPFSIEFSPVRIAIVTARNAPAEMRVIMTLRHWGVYVDEVFFLGGMDKAKVLKAFRPHIFFDDQDLHLKEISQAYPAGKVPHHTNSELDSDESEND
jgi:5'-nucleotidase